MSSRSSSSAGDLTTSKILAWARGLETFERVDFVYLLMHSLFPTELRYIHGIIDGLLKRDESLYASSIHQANDFVRLSHFYEGHDPHLVIGNDGLRRQFIVDLSALHPLNFYCADIFFGVLQRAELGTWTFNRDNQKVLRELILITTMVARHAAFRFDNRLFIWNIARILTQKLRVLKEAEEEEICRQDSEDLEHSFVHPVDSDPVELQSTVTTSGADRLLNGFMEEPQRPGGVFPSKPENLPLNAQSAAAFPPLSAPVGPHLPISPITPATTRLKSAQLAKPKESVAMGNLGTRNPGDITSVAPEPNRTVNVRNSKALSSHPQRANSMENCDFNHYSEEPKGEEPRSRHLTTQRSAPSTSEFPKQRPDAPMRAAFPPQHPALLGANVHESIHRSEFSSSSGRSPASVDEIVVPEVVSEPWHSPVTNRTVNNVGISGQFPRIYALAPPNGPRFAHQNNTRHIPNLPHPALSKSVSCYNCGINGHYGETCPKKKPMDPEQAEKYCALQRDAKLYPERGRPSSRHTGPRT